MPCRMKPGGAGSVRIGAMTRGPDAGGVERAVGSSRQGEPARGSRGERRLQGRGPSQTWSASGSPSGKFQRSAWVQKKASPERTQGILRQQGPLRGEQHEPCCECAGGLSGLAVSKFRLKRIAASFMEAARGLEGHRAAKVESGAWPQLNASPGWPGQRRGGATATCESQKPVSANQLGRPCWNGRGSYKRRAMRVGHGICAFQSRVFFLCE